MPLKKKRTKKRDGISLSSDFCVSDMAATSSPTPKNPSNLDALLLLVEEHFQLEKDEFIREAEECTKHIKYQFHLFRMKMKPSELQKTVGSFLAKDETQKTKSNMSSLQHSGRRRSSSLPPPKKTGQIDKEGFKIPARVRSSSRHRKSPQYYTPLNSRLARGYKNIAFVTPGPNINTPLSVMRRPMVGEQAISLDGSPLLLSTDVDSLTCPNVTVPLAKDKVISIFPREGFDVNDMPPIDYETKNQLEKLKKYIGDILDHC